MEDYRVYVSKLSALVVWVSKSKPSVLKLMQIIVLNGFLQVFLLRHRSHLANLNLISTWQMMMISYKSNLNGCFTWFRRWTSVFFFTYVLERHFVALGLCCPHSINSNTSLYYLWMGLKCQPIDDSSPICSKACLTCTHLEPTCCHWLNPHSGWRMNTWKLLAMAHWHVNLDLRNVHSEDITRHICYSSTVCCEKKNVDALSPCAPS